MQGFCSKEGIDVDILICVFDLGWRQQRFLWTIDCDSRHYTGKTFGRLFVLI